jgi:hypothetical protein
LNSKTRTQFVLHRPEPVSLRIQVIEMALGPKNLLGFWGFAFTRAEMAVVVLGLKLESSSGPVWLEVL